MITYNHRRLFSSPHRNKWFYEQIKQACSGKVCMDIGTGSGVLSLFAIQAGAKHVFMLDHNIDCCNMVKDVFEYNNIPKNKYTIIHDRVDDNFKFTNTIDVIISETISSDFFGRGFQDICKTIQNIEALKDAVIIPDKIYGALTFFESMDGIENAYQLFDEWAVPEKLYTGVEEIDTTYTVWSHMLGEQKNDYQLACRPYLNPQTVYEKAIVRVWHDAKNSQCFIIEEAITYDAYNPFVDLEWYTKVNIPNKTYGIYLTGYLECERTNSTRHAMYKDVWATYFYKFVKTNNNLKIEYDTKINNFVFT